MQLRIGACLCGGERLKRRDSVPFSNFGFSGLLYCVDPYRPIEALE